MGQAGRIVNNMAKPKLNPIKTIKTRARISLEGPNGEKLLVLSYPDLEEFELEFMIFGQYVSPTLRESLPPDMFVQDGMAGHGEASMTWNRIFIKGLAREHKLLLLHYLTLEREANEKRIRSDASREGVQDIQDV